MRTYRCVCFVLAALCLLGVNFSIESAEVPGTKPLTATGDLAAAMVAGIDKYLDRATAESVEKRKQFWKLDYSSLEAYAKSVEPNRERLRSMLGVGGKRLPPAMEQYSRLSQPPVSVDANRLRFQYVRWPVLPGVMGEGLLLEPPGKIVANIVALPDAGWPPEMFAGLVNGAKKPSEFLHKLVANGCRIVVPNLIDRGDEWSRYDRIRRQTNIPHREFIYRMAFEMGRHPIGLEVESSLAVVDWFSRDQGHAPVAIVGIGEGGLIAEFAAALDPRIVSTMVFGYAGPRAADIANEPIDRNIWGLSREFGPVELGSLILPRHFNVASGWAQDYPGPAKQKSGAAPGRVVPATDQQLEEQIRPLIALYQQTGVKSGLPRVLSPGDALDDVALKVMLSTVNATAYDKPLSFRAQSAEQSAVTEPAGRRKSQFDSLVNYSQRLWRDGEFTRDEFFWRKLKPARSSPEKWDSLCDPLRTYFHEEVIGKLPPPSVPPNPRSRQVYDESKWTGHEVVLDLHPDVFAYGILLTPKDLKPGEKRPVVVCQHGLEGTPRSCIDPEKNTVYNRFAAKLADLGYVVYCPQNPYIGGTAFRQLQRKANPLKLSLFSFITQQHSVTIDWLEKLPYVDPSRIAFYGLSYGGKTAMRVPAIEKRYCLSICSADFNDWVGKCVSVDLPMSYMYMGEYELPEFNLGNTFNYAEMAGLIAPRPFMVERGHDDGVGIDEWVAAEYAKVRRLYAKLGIPERTTIEFFNGGHEIRGVGTFAFLKQHLNFPK